MNHKELAVVNGLKEIGQDMIEQMNDNKYSFKFQVESDKVGEENVSASMLYFLHKKGLISTPRIVCKIKILTSERENTRGESKGAYLKIIDEEFRTKYKELLDSIIKKRFVDGIDESNFFN